MIDIIEKKMNIAEKSIKSLILSEDLKKVSNSIEIANFYETKALNRLQSTRLIYSASSSNVGYSDYGEAVAASYYSMYYIVHSFLALVYKTKLMEDVRGVHAITHNIILYYLVKTKMLAAHLYEEYVKTLETTEKIHKLTIDSFQEEAFSYAKKYDKSREAREVFTYQTSAKIEATHSEKSIKIAEEFVNTIRLLMIRK